MELKHVGRLAATKKKCVVVYRTLPGDAHYCLIVPTESLPDNYHDALINLVESNAGQSAYEFAEAMARSPLPDGTNMLSSFHVQGRLVKAKTSDVEMTPIPGATIQLSELNQLIAEQRGLAVDDLSIKNAPTTNLKESEEVTPVLEDNSAAKTTSSGDGVEQTESVKFDTVEAEAKHYRSQADKLAKQAAEFRRKAEELVPTRKPAAK